MNTTPQPQIAQAQNRRRLDKAYPTKVYNSDFTITLDELPKWSQRIAAQQPALKTTAPKQKPAPLSAKPKLK